MNPVIIEVRPSVSINHMFFTDASENIKFSKDKKEKTI